MKSVPQPNTTKLNLKQEEAKTAQTLSKQNALSIEAAQFGGFKSSKRTEMKHSQPNQKLTNTVDVRNSAPLPDSFLIARSRMSDISDTSSHDSSTASSSSNESVIKPPQVEISKKTIEIVSSDDEDDGSSSSAGHYEEDKENVHQDAKLDPVSVSSQISELKKRVKSKQVRTV